MEEFKTKTLSEKVDTIAPDGSEVRLLLGINKRGGMAHFKLAPGKISVPVAHKTVEEIWYFIEGSGQMWRKQGDREDIVEIKPGVCINIPFGTYFQFTSEGVEPLTALGVTMPPWPQIKGYKEAYQVFCETPWEATTKPGDDLDIEYWELINSDWSGNSIPNTIPIC